MVQKIGQFLPKDDDVDDVYGVDVGDGQATDEEKKFSELIDALNGDSDAYVSVHRESSGAKNGEFIARIPADKFDHAQILESLRDDYGGGDYRLRVYVSGRIRANKLFTVASKLRREGNTGEGDTLKLVMNQMEKMNQQMMQLMQGGSGGGSRKEIFAEIAMMKEIFGDGKRSGGVGELLEMVAGLKSLGIAVGIPSEPEEKGFGHLLELAAPMFAQAVQGGANVRDQSVSGEVQGANTRAVNVQKPQNNGEKMSMIIAANLTPLVNAAKKNSDQEIYAPMVVDMVPESVLQKFFAAPDGLEELIKIRPDIRNHVEWFKVLGEHVKAILGMPSTVGELYSDFDSASVNENVAQVPGDNGENNLHNASDT